MDGRAHIISKRVLSHSHDVSSLFVCLFVFYNLPLFCKLYWQFRQHTIRWLIRRIVICIFASNRIWFGCAQCSIQYIYICVNVTFFGVWKPFSKSFATIKIRIATCVNNRKCLHFSCCVFVIMRSLLLLYTMCKYVRSQGAIKVPTK